MSRTDPNTPAVRYWSLDFWRGIACLMVIVAHSSAYLLENASTQVHGRVANWVCAHLLSRGGYGVPIFFVISGYCITASCITLRARSHSIGKYFVRRFRRIFPPYWAVVALFLAAYLILARLGHADLFSDSLSLSVPDPRTFTWAQWISGLTLTHTWAAPLMHAKVFDTLLLGPAWTLCYEEQFYAVCGLLLFLMPRRFFGGSLILSVAILALLLFRLWRPLPINGYFFDGYWLVFALGVLVYYALHVARPAARHATTAFLAVAFVATQIWRPFHISNDLHVGVVTALGFVILYRFDHQIITSRLARPFAMCGIMCYSLYLVHFPIVKAASHLMYDAGLRGTWPTVFLGIPVCIALSVAAGWWFHVLVERRFMNTIHLLPPLSAPDSAGPIAVSAASTV